MEITNLQHKHHITFRDSPSFKYLKSLQLGSLLITQPQYTGDRTLTCLVTSITQKSFDSHSASKHIAERNIDCECQVCYEDFVNTYIEVLVTPDLCDGALYADSLDMYVVFP